MDISIVINDYFKILRYFYEKSDDKGLVKITQGEIGEVLGYSRITINRVMPKFKEQGLIYQDTSHIGHYYITEKGRKVVEIVLSLEKI